MSPIDVLIVDDDREIVRAIELRLRNGGFQTTVAFNGQQGLEMAKQSRPDVILMDLRMPVMDGFTMLKRLQNSVLTANFPAIVLSANSADRARLQARRGGATFFVEKPYKSEDLLRALNAAVKPSQRAAPIMAPPERIMPIASEAKVEPIEGYLIADDDPAVRLIANVIRSCLGHTVWCSDRGRTAISVLVSTRSP